MPWWKQFSILAIGLIGGYVLREKAPGGNLDLYVPYMTMSESWRPGKQLGCEAKGAAVIFEKPTLDDDKKIKVTAGYGTDKLALSRSGDAMTMLTGASVAIGSMEGTPLRVVSRPVKDIVIAVTSNNEDGPRVINAIVLDETTGNAMWVRAGFGFNGLTGQSYYLECR
jgi:hypothetical protein